jgi:hypothetical protein
VAVYITAGPMSMRTALRSFVARDIRSPVRLRWKVVGVEPLQMREEVVAEVVLEAARRTDDHAAHEKAKDAAHGRQHKQQAA